MTHLLCLPVELLEKITQQLDFEDVVSVQLTCRLLRAGVGPTVWRSLYARQYRNFISEYHRLRSNPSVASWRTLFLRRKRIDAQASLLFEKVMTSSNARVVAIEQFGTLGYEAKEYLQEQAKADPRRDDSLARQFWSRNVLKFIHRQKAIKLWQALAEGRPPPLECCLTAFGLFLLEDGVGDDDEVSSKLDEYAQHFREANPNHVAMSSRRRALALAEFLHQEQLLGIRSGHSYYHYKNNHFHRVLFDAPHNSIPLMSSVIYVCIAQRLDLAAFPVLFPGHVHVCVDLSANQGPDTETKPLRTPSEYMLLDTWTHSHEVTLGDVAALLTAVNPSVAVPPTSLARFIVAPTTNDLCMRTLMNLENVRHQIHPLLIDDGGADREWREVSEDLSYSMAWARSMLQQDEILDREIIATVSLELYAPDINMTREYVLSRPHLQHQSLILEHLAAFKGRGQLERPLKPRDGTVSPVSLPLFRIGQVFRHKRYHYAGVVVGWDIACAASLEWQRQMRVSDLSRGNRQPFYNVVTLTDYTERYVAEDNIEVTRLQPSDQDMMHMGRWMKRWDPEAFEFVSNLQEQYPDD